MEALRGHTSGLAVPQFVVDLPGGGCKVPLQPDYLLEQRDGEFVFRNYEGRIFRCRNPRRQKGPDRTPLTIMHKPHTTLM